METPSSVTLLKPRLRLLRRSPSPRLQDNGPMDNTPGSSSARTHFTNFADDEDEQPTPRMPPKVIASPNGGQGPSSLAAGPSATGIPADTPAARLRALLARELRSPRNLVSTDPQTSPSEVLSDDGAPRSGSTTSSVARESLKDLFSRALREPGDTPQKGRLRRNSVDNSEVDITPMLGRGRVKHKSKRRSLSDEEVERPKSTKESDTSLRSSQATTFDTLRARLMSSQSQLIEQNAPTAIYDQSDSPVMPINPPDHRVPDNFERSRQFNLSPGTPPAATSTPHRSFQLPSQLAYQSNLLEQDSEMQRAMGDVLGSENEVSMSVRNLDQSRFTLPRSHSSLSFRESLRDSETKSRRASHELEPSQATSLSRVEVSKQQNHSREEDRNHQRERDWNRPRTQSQSSIPDLRHPQEFRSPSHVKSTSHESAMLHSGSPRPLHGLQRQGSLASLRSFDDDRLSRPSSTSSQADYRDRVSELDRERHHEREREWNRRHPPARPSSSLSTSSNHSHSHSHPSRPPSATPYLTPTLASLQRQSSCSSLRSSSPSSSLASRVSGEQGDEEQKEVAHERERNWNSPHPHWATSKRHSHGGSEKEGIVSPAFLRKSQDSSKGNRSLRASSSLSSLVAPDDQRSSPPSNMHSQRVEKGSVHSLSRRHISPSQSKSSHMDGFARVHSSSPRKPSAAASQFGWHFSRAQNLPPLELESPSEGHAQRQDESYRRTRDSPPPTPSSRSSSRASVVVKSSLIPIRSVPKSSTNGLGVVSSIPAAQDEAISSKKGHHRGLTELSESVGRIPSRIAEDSWGQEDMVLASDEESIRDFLHPQSTTPRTEPPGFTPEEVATDTETEVLASPAPSPSSSRRGTTSPLSEPPTQREFDESAQTPASDSSLSQPSSPPGLPTSFTPPGTPPSGTPDGGVHPFPLTTPPRQTSLSGSSILDFRTPSPPHDLPYPPPSSDDDALGAEGTPSKPSGQLISNPNNTAMKTPRPPGAWAVTPLNKPDPRASSPALSSPTRSTPTSASAPLPRANSYPEAQWKAETVARNGLVTPVASLSRANSLPLRTPAPPGAWMATPNQPSTQNGTEDQSQFGSVGRRRSILKVRFDVTESEASAAEGPHEGPPVSAIRLTNPELPVAKPIDASAAQGRANAGAVVNGPTSLAIVSIPPRPATPERPSTPVSRSNAPSPRSLRKSPSVRVVDAYGRERVDNEASVEAVPPTQNGHAELHTVSPSTSRSTSRNMVRIVDAMGRKVDEVAEQMGNAFFEADTSTVSDDAPLGHAAALARMRQTLRDLAEGLSEADRSAEDLALDSSHLEELDEVSKAARLARNQLAQNLQLETAKELGMRRNHNSQKATAWVSRILPDAINNGKSSWTRAIMYWGIIIQLILVIAMWRYAHMEARRLFYTTYYDPLYPELYPIQGSSYLTGTLSLSRPWSMLDSYDTVRREGWTAFCRELLRALTHAVDRLWKSWGEHHPYTDMIEKPT